jgi:hypothetical protein
VEPARPETEQRFLEETAVRAIRGRPGWKKGPD